MPTTKDESQSQELERQEQDRREGREGGGSAGPRQTVSRLPLDTNIGPNFPSGMSAPEAALAGATADMSDDEIAQLKGEKKPEVEEEQTEG